MSTAGNCGFCILRGRNSNRTLSHVDDVLNALRNSAYTACSNKRTRRDSWAELTCYKVRHEPQRVIVTAVIVVLRPETNQFVTATITTSNDPQRQPLHLHRSPHLALVILPRPLTWTRAPRRRFSGYVNLIAFWDVTCRPHEPR